MKHLQTFTSDEIKRLPGNAEVVSKTLYTKPAARRRLAGKLPADLTPGGIFILEAITGPASVHGRALKRYLLLSYTGGDTQ